jgi:hypothetical protein
MEELYRLVNFIEDSCIAYEIINEMQNGVQNKIRCRSVKKIVSGEDNGVIKITTSDFVFEKKIHFDLAISLCSSKFQIQDILYFSKDSNFFNLILSRTISSIIVLSNGGENSIKVIHQHNDEDEETNITFRNRKAFDSVKVKLYKLQDYYRRSKLIRMLYHMRLFCITNNITPILDDRSIFGSEIVMLSDCYNCENIFIDDKNVAEQLYRYLFI